MQLQDNNDGRKGRCGHAHAHAPKYLERSGTQKASAASVLTPYPQPEARAKDAGWSELGAADDTSTSKDFRGFGGSEDVKEREGRGRALMGWRGDGRMEEGGGGGG